MSINNRTIQSYALNAAAYMLSRSSALARICQVHHLRGKFLPNRSDVGNVLVGIFLNRGTAIVPPQQSNRIIERIALILARLDVAVEVCVVSTGQVYASSDSVQQLIG